MHVNADRHTHACTDKHTDAWPHHVAHRLIMWAGVLGDSIGIFVTSEVWVWLWWPVPTALQLAAPPATSPALISSSVSVLQTDFEKDVDLACRSGERLTGESHGGQSALLLLSLLLASVCFTCPHPTPTTTWPSLGPLLLKGFRRPVCVTERAPESCCGAGLGPPLFPLHVSVSPFSSHRTEQTDQLCVGPSPAPPLPCTLTVTCLLPALPQTPMFCVVFVSLLLNWGRGGVGAL